MGVAWNDVARQALVADQVTLKVGSNGPQVAAWQRAMLVRFSGYAKEADGQPLRPDAYFGYSDRDVQLEYQRRTQQDLTGQVSDHDLAVLGVVKVAPPKPRHKALTFRGTGGIVGLDYTSRVAQLCGDLVEELPIDYPASMGGIPVGAANNISAPSGQKCTEIAFENAARLIESSAWTFTLHGYSLGAIPASKIRAALLPGGRLENHAHRYVCGTMFGNPARAFGHTFYLGAIPSGFGIADWHLPQEACTWGWLECVDPGDLYGNAAGGEIGEVLRSAYRMIMDIQVSDPIGMAGALIRNVLHLLDEAGIELPFSIPGLVTGALAGLLLAFLPAEFAKYLTVGDKVAAAAVQAAILALRFFADQPPTAAHISYEFRHAIPGVTYLDLAAQHVRHWATTKSVAA